MNRINTCFQALKDKKALITFITAGDPKPHYTVPLLHELVAAGADILELGMPFSEPVAEGPVIQAACERALEQGMTLNKTLNLVAEFREQDVNTPVVLMGYLNPIETMGYEHFATRAAEAGVDGLIIVDLPFEEAAEFSAILTTKGIHLIYLIAPTTPISRVKQIVEHAAGFLYCVSLKGVTGSGFLAVDTIQEQLHAIRRCTSLPLAVGFGIKDGATAKAMSIGADAVVVGSALVQKIADAPNLEAARHAVQQWVSELRASF